MSSTQHYRKNFIHGMHRMVLFFEKSKETMRRSTPTAHAVPAFFYLYFSFAVAVGLEGKGTEQALADV